MSSYRFGPYLLDRERKVLLRDHRQLALTPKAFDTLAVLISRPGEAVSKTELMSQVWPGVYVEEGTLTQNISTIRKAIGDHWIETVPRHGYRFVHAVLPVGSTKVAEANVRRGRLLAGVLTATLLIVLTGIAARGWLRNGKDSTFPAESVDYATRNGSVLLFAVSRDGRTLAYASGILTRQSLHLKDLLTGQETELLKAGGLHFMGLTIHGSSLYFVARGTGEQSGSAYQMSLAGRSGEKLFSGVDSPVSFSPDGLRISFVREDRGAGESRLMVSQSDGSQAQVLASAKLPSYLDYPEWSPDGRHIVATKIDREDNHVLVFESASGRARRLGGRWGFPMYPRWMPDGREVVLIARGIAQPGRQVWSVSWPDGEAKPITQDLDEYVALQVSSDGKALFAVNRKMATSIWTGPSSDPGLARQIGFGTGTRAMLAWTRDRTLVYELEGNLWRISPDGSRTQLTWEGNSYHPSACRESGNLVFIIHGTRRGMFFHVMGPDGRLLHRIPVRRAMSPECSPDGRWIAFVDGGKPGYPLVRVDLDTNREVVLNSSKTAGVAVSADGTRVAQLSEEPDELRVLPAAGGAPLRSYSLPSGNNAMPGVVRWTPDGKGLAYVDRSGAGNVWIQRLEGGPPRQLTKLNNEWVLSFDWSFDGNQLGMIRAVMVQDVVTIRERPVP